MDIIFNTLSDILELLEQIDTITQNQKLVLLLLSFKTMRPIHPITFMLIYKRQIR